jgi:4Fe-4S ferredoxin
MNDFHPVIDRNACEGKAECVALCPVNVFEMGVLPAEQRKALTLLGKVKGFVHGWSQAFAVNAKACEACGLCVKNCPEEAISLVRNSAG